MSLKIASSQRKKTERETFSDLAAYEELMARPYFVYLKQKITKELEKYHFKNKKILEIGAGRSEFLKLFDKNNEVTALDISPVLLKENKNKAKLVVGDAENLPFSDETFDFVYAVGVFHHLENQKKAFGEITRVLKNDGRFFISEPTKISLNLPYYLIRRLMILLLGNKKYQKVSGCGSLEETFIDEKVFEETFAKDWQIKKEKQLPLRMPPVGFLEKWFSKRVNDFLENLPVFKYFGSIIFLKGQKKIIEKPDLGFGTEYEIFILKKIAKNMVNKYKIKSILEYPKTSLLGEEKIFDVKKIQRKPDLVWNFCEFENTHDSSGFISKLADLTDKYVLVITQNYLNPGVFIHRLWHLIIEKKWDHGILRKMSSKEVVKAAESQKLRVIETGAFDVPWFVLDVYETGKYLRKLPFMENKTNEMKESRLESWPKWFKLLLSHHHYLLLEKNK